MKHCILVKWKDDFDWKSKIDEIKNIFNFEDIKGINFVEYLFNCVDKENRYDLLIRIDMEEEALPIYDSSSQHHKWKEDFGPFIEKKAIFDYK